MGLVNEYVFEKEVKSHIFWKKRPILRRQLLYLFDLIWRLKAANKILRQRNTKLIKKSRVKELL